MIQEAQMRYPGYRFEVRDMTQMENIASADLIFFIASFHHLVEEGDQNICLDHIHSVLNPGGRCVFLNWNLTSEKLTKKYPIEPLRPNIRIIPFDTTIRLYRAWSVEELSSILQIKGFKVLYANTTITGANMIHIFEKN